MHSSMTARNAFARRSPSPCIVLVSRDGSRFVVPNAAATYSHVLCGALEQWSAACRPPPAHRSSRHHTNNNSSSHPNHNDNTSNMFSEGEESETDGEADSSTACELGAAQTASTADNHTDEDDDEDDEDGRWSEANRSTRRNSARHSAGGSTCSYKSDVGTSDRQPPVSTGQGGAGPHEERTRARSHHNSGDTNKDDDGSRSSSSSTSSTSQEGEEGEKRHGQVRTGSLVRRMVSAPVVDSEEEEEEEEEESSEEEGSEDSRTLSSPSVDEHDEEEDLSGAIVIGEAGNQMCLRSRIVRRARPGRRARCGAKRNGTATLPVSASGASPSGLRTNAAEKNKDEEEDDAMKENALGSPPHTPTDVTTLPSDGCNGMMGAEKLREGDKEGQPALVCTALLPEANNNDEEGDEEEGTLSALRRRPSNGHSTPPGDGAAGGRGSGGSSTSGSGSSSSLANTSRSAGSSNSNNSNKNSSAAGNGSRDREANLSGRRRRSLFDTEVVVVRAMDEDLVANEAAAFVFPGSSVAAEGPAASLGGNATGSKEDKTATSSLSFSSATAPVQDKPASTSSSSLSLHSAAAAQAMCNGVQPASKQAAGSAADSTVAVAQPVAPRSCSEDLVHAPPTEDHTSTSSAAAALPSHSLGAQAHPPLPSRSLSSREASEAHACLTPHELVPDEEWGSPRSFHQRTPCMIEVDENKDELHLISCDGQERVIHTAHIAAELAQLSPAAAPPSAALPEAETREANKSSSPREAALTQGVDESHTRSMAGLTEQDTTVNAERADKEEEEDEEEMPHSRTSNNDNDDDDDDGSSHTTSEAVGLETNTTTADSEAVRRGLQREEGSGSDEEGEGAGAERCISTYDCAQITPRSIIVDFRVASLTNAGEAATLVATGEARGGTLERHEDPNRGTTQVESKAEQMGAAIITTTTTKATREAATPADSNSVQDKAELNAAVQSSATPESTTSAAAAAAPTESSASSKAGTTRAFSRRAVRLCAEYLRRLVQAAQKAALFSYLPDSRAVAGATSLPCPLPRPLIALLLPWEVDFVYHDVLRLGPSAMERVRRILSVCPELDYRYSLPELRKESVRAALDVPAPGKAGLEALTTLLKLARQLQIDTLAALCNACLADYTLRMVYSAEDHFAAARAIRECFHVVNDYSERETEGLQIENEWPANE